MKYTSIFKVNIVATNTIDKMKFTSPIEVLVDTGSELTWLPADLLKAIGILPNKKKNFQTVTKQIVTPDIGYAILSAEGYETIDEVAFTEPGDMNLLGVHTLEGFGVMVDNIAHRFEAKFSLIVYKIHLKLRNK